MEPTSPEPPPDLYGRGRSDRALAGLTGFIQRYTGLMLRGSERRLARTPRPPATEAALTVRVAERTARAEDVVALRLVRPDGAPLPEWQPGSHLDLTLPSGRRRQYSLCGDPADRYGYRVAVRRLDGGGGGSLEVHRDLTPGTRLRISRPRNAFPFAGEPSVLFLAGGIGITPVLPMVREAEALGLDWRLVHTGRSRASLPFTGELAALHPDRVEVRADEEAGVPDAGELLDQAPPGAAVYCCGPPPMLEAVRRAFDRAPEGRLVALHFERFAPAPILDGRPFQLQLGPSGPVLDVPEDRSALDVLRDRSPATPYSCRQGFCGVCRQRVLSGTVEHRDRRLTDQERASGAVLVCVSRADAGERLVLDL
ncbi:PDR/VanB family oxidoreductase [Streptomyces sp. NPDC005438]|uniref:PDR/VanB family oxidoreductase n=1 Tax=Streptomyces sp. NPDC005438 TaxID=3156880 RepID=UPI0033A903DB